MFKILIGNPKDVSGIILKWTAMVYIQDLFGRLRGTKWFSLLRHCATFREFMGSIPDDIIGIFHLHYPSGGTMTLGSIQPLEKLVPGIFPGVRGGRCVGLTTLSSS
jgi:hypothetical protein